jgi:hypothetical protein
MRSLMDDDEHRRLVSLLLDGLDDLYDQRYAARQQSAEVWLARLLLTAAVAYKDTKLDKELQDAATALSAIIRSGGAPPDQGDAALAATDGLRHTLAAEA